MQNKKKNMRVVILFIILILIILFSVFHLFLKNKVCPDEFSDNQMPRVCMNGNDCGSYESRFYIKDGKRVEFSQYNELFVLFICAIPKEVSY